MPRPNLKSRKKGVSTKSRLEHKLRDEITDLKKRIIRLRNEGRNSDADLIQRRLEKFIEKNKSNQIGRIRKNLKDRKK